MSKRNENRQGYKESKVGWIPNDWRVASLGKIAKITMGQSPASENYNSNGVGLPLIQGNADIRNGKSAPRYWTSQITKECQVGDVLLSVRAPVGEISLSKHNACIGRGICSLRFNNENLYLYHYLIYFEPKWFRYSQGSTFKAIITKEIKKLSIPVPTLSEQRKIAEILSIWGRAIELVGKLIEVKFRLKNELMRRLIPGKLRYDVTVDRLPDGWHTYRIGEVLKRERQPVQVEKDQVYREIGIRSHTKGIFYKEETTGANLGNKAVFWIIPNRFILNIVFAWEQAVARTTYAEEGMIASHRFPMYKPKDDLIDLDYLLYFFQTPYGKHLLGLASPGGAGRNKTLGQDTFMKLSITLPSIDEQMKIGSLVKLCDQELEILKKRENALRRQKKGLMQKLLTGEMRVSV